MIKPIAIVAGEPNSISSEIIFKTWKLKSQYNNKPFFIIGSIQLLVLQFKKLNYKINIKEINNNFKINDLKGKDLPVYNIDYIQKKPFEKISSKSNKYIFKSFDAALKFVNNKKIIGFINCPVYKETLFKKKHHGITEFLSSKVDKKKNEVMLIFNKDLSVSPLTTHIPIDNVKNKINKYKLIQNIKIIDSFYKKNFKIKPNIGILGLNPHNFTNSKNSVEKKIIPSVVKKLIKNKINVRGPISPDSSFVIFKKYNLNVLIGMYHDQVLSPFKALYNFKAINITLGLPFIRVSPDHGVAEDMVGKKKANPTSLIESVKFFNNIK